MLKMRHAGLALLVLALGLTLGCGDKAADTTGDAGTSPADDVYVAKSDSLEELQKVAGPLGIELEDVGEIEVHRGSSDDLVTLYWPQRDVTKEGLQTFRIDVGDEYEDDGKLEFRIGKTVLYSEPFAPEDTVTVAAVPQSVIDAVKRGKNVKWGVFFEGRKKRRSISSRFKLVDGKKAGNRLKKLEGSKHFQRQTPLTRELLKTQVLENSRLYSEALVQYLGILQVWPDSTQPFRGIVSCCRRMDLKDTPLYTIASSFVRGKGSKPSSKYRPGTSGASGATPQAHTGEAKLVLRAPTYQKRGPDGFKPSQLGPHGGTPGATGAQPSGTAGPSGPKVPSAADAYRVLDRLAQELEGRAAQMAEEAKALGLLAEKLSEAEQHLMGVEKEKAQAEKDLAQKTEALQSLVAEKDAGNPNGIADLDAKIAEAEKDREEAQGLVDQLTADRDEAVNDLQQMERKAGTDATGVRAAAAKAKAEADKLAAAAQEARRALGMEAITPAQQEAKDLAAQQARDKALEDLRREVDEAFAERDSAQSRLDDLRQQLEGLDPDSPEAEKLNETIADAEVDLANAAARADSLGALLSEVLNGG